LENDWRLMWGKKAANGKSHDMRSVCKTTFESEASKSEERKVQSRKIQGTSTILRRSKPGQKVWKAFKFGSSRRVIIVPSHIGVVKTPRKTLIGMWHRWCSKIFLSNNSFTVPFLWPHWYFKLNEWSWLLASFRLKKRNYISVGFFLGSPRPPWRLFVADEEADKFKVHNSLRGFSQWDNCWR